MARGFDRRTLVFGGAAAAIAPMPALAWTMTAGIADSKVRPATRWLVDTFGDDIRTGLSGSPVTLPLACAIACQESAYTWWDRPKFVQGRTPAQRMELILDNVSGRAAFPHDTKTFLKDRRFADLAPGLIRACDASRQARGYPATGGLLYGYGLFQYDIQHIETDAAFWRDQLWTKVDMCAARLVRELAPLIAAHPGDLKSAVTAYNGRGANARAYGEIVMRYHTLVLIELGGSAR